ncbi:hypothetical protein SUGI_1096740 [Cryptomeria japonica]|nr:hypothetical protein SUGI_1096740 [Cryptomeria japonica]
MKISEPYEPDEGLLLELASASKSESEMNQKGRIAMNGEQIEMDNKIWSELPEELLMLVLSSLPTLIGRNFSLPLGVYPFWLDFLGRGRFSVLTSCKGILCCRSSHTQGDPTLYYISNPLTRTSLSLRPPPDPKRLPPYRSPSDFVRYLGFYGLAFDSATRSCILVIAYNNTINGERNNMEMQIYDSY